MTEGQPRFLSLRASRLSATLRDSASRITGTNYHPTSTCAIGRVVDSDLRVFGTEGLRVADASVMRSIVRGNINVAVIAIAEKAADILLGKRTRQGAKPALVA